MYLYVCVHVCVLKNSPIMALGDRANYQTLLHNFSHILKKKLRDELHIGKGYYVVVPGKRQNILPSNKFKNVLIYAELTVLLIVICSE